MSLIGHKACPRCYRTHADIAGEPDGPGCGDYLNCPGTMEVFVPLGDYRGAVEALKFYADPKSWDYIDPIRGTFTTNYPANRDRGERARAALRKQ